HAPPACTLLDAEGHLDLGGGMRVRLFRNPRLVFGLTLAILPDPRLAAAAVSAPALKWAYGGCISGPYCQTGWYSSPAVADLDGDGMPEVIWGAYDVVVLNGATGALRARAANGSRVWPGIAVADLTGDGSLEIVVGRGDNQLHVYRFQPPSTLSVVWSRHPFTNNCAGNDCEVRTLAVEDLETDGIRDVIVGRASGGDTEQLNAYDGNGNRLAGAAHRRAGIRLGHVQRERGRRRHERRRAQGGLRPHRHALHHRARRQRQPAPGEQPLHRPAVLERGGGPRERRRGRARLCHVRDRAPAQLRRQRPRHRGCRRGRRARARRRGQRLQLRHESLHRPVSDAAHLE